MSATPQLPVLAKVERKMIIDMVATGKRVDDRTPDQYRDLHIKTGIIEKANGSAEVHLGKTKVLVGVKVEIGEPFRDAPDEGVLTVNAELVPLASPLFEPGPPDENSIELARVVDRGIRGSGAIDLKALCVEEGRKVFVTFIDIYVLDHDGNLIDASATAALAALLNAKMRDYEVKDGEVIYRESYVPLPIKNYPIAVTVAKIDGTLVIDPCLEEEQVMSARLTITVDKGDNICAIQKGGLGSVTPDELKTAVSMAVIRSAEIRRKVLEATG